MRSILLLSFIILTLSVKKSIAQNFTIIDTLPEGAYGNAAWGDFDGDGFKDLVYISQVPPDAVCKVYHNVNNVFTEVSQQFPLLYNPGVKWADLDNDGFDDFVANGMDSAFINRTFIYKSLGNGTFLPIPNTIHGLTAGAVDIADYNNDGWKDIAVTGMDSVGVEHAYIYKNLGGFNFTDINAPLIGIHFGQLKWGDYNNDGLADLVINGIGAGDFRTRVYLNMSADSFALQPFYMKGSGGTVDWADLDHDGWLDILVTGYDSTSSNNFTEVHHNNQDGTFSLITTNLPIFGEPSGVAVADYNLDGNLDACFIGGSNDFPTVGSALSINTGLLTYNSQPFFHGNIIDPIIKAADIDGDGDYDLIFSNFIIRNDFTTNIQSNSGDENKLSVFPNPAAFHIVIKSPYPVKSLTVYDDAGRTIETTTPFNNILNVEAIPPGVYFLKIESPGVSVFKRLTIIR